MAYTGNRVTALSSPKVQRELGGAAWVLMLDDVCRADVDGRAVLCDGVPCTIWEWMGKQHL